MIWTEEMIRKELRRLDKITGLRGSELPIKFRTKGKACGWFRHSQGGVLEFGFSLSHLNDPKLPEMEKIDTIRHEYAHFLDYVWNGKTGHTRSWKAACQMVGAKPLSYMDTIGIARLKEKEKEQARKDKHFIEKYHQGDTVLHPYYGLGTILSVLKAGSKSWSVVISFANCGDKRLSLEWVDQNCILKQVADI